MHYEMRAAKYANAGGTAYGVCQKLLARFAMGQPEGLVRLSPRRAQEILLGAPYRTGLDGVIQIPIDILQLSFEPADVLGDAPAHGGQGQVA